MSHIKTHPTDYGWSAPPAITCHVLRENKRPIGFAPWPEEETVEEPPLKKKRKRKKTSPSNKV